jgi:hypothetical protein
MSDDPIAGKTPVPLGTSTLLPNGVAPIPMPEGAALPPAETMPVLVPVAGAEPGTAVAVEAGPIVTEAGDPVADAGTRETEIPAVAREPRDAGDPAIEKSEIEVAIAHAYVSSVDGTDFAAALAEAGITLARVTENDIVAIETESRRDPARQFPPVMVGEMVAVDRFGDVHRLDPRRSDAAAIEARFNETRMTPVETKPVTASVAEAHAAFAANYQPSAFKRFRDGVRAKLDQVSAHIAAARNGDHRGMADGLAAVVDLLGSQLGHDAPEDCLRTALAALASGRTVDAAQALAEARTGLTTLTTGPYIRGYSPGSWGPERTVEKIDAASAALTAGDRPTCLRLTEEALADVEPHAVHYGETA